MRPAEDGRKGSIGASARPRNDCRRAPFANTIGSVGEPRVAPWQRDSNLLSRPSIVFPNGAGPHAPQRKLLIDGLNLSAGWYRLSVAIAGAKGLVSASVRGADERRPALTLRLESTQGGHFSKILKVSQPVVSIALRVDGKSEGVTRVEARRLGFATVFGFMVTKCARYVSARRGRLDPLVVYRKALSTLRPNANFAFRAHYQLSDADAYPRWRTIHEDAASG